MKRHKINQHRLPCARTGVLSTYNLEFQRDIVAILGEHDDGDVGFAKLADAGTGKYDQPCFQPLVSCTASLSTTEQQAP